MGDVIISCGGCDEQVLGCDEQVCGMCQLPSRARVKVVDENHCA